MKFSTCIEPRKGDKAVHRPFIRSGRKGSVERKPLCLPLALLRRRNAREYRITCGITTVWPPLPGTSGADALAGLYCGVAPTAHRINLAPTEDGEGMYSGIAPLPLAEVTAILTRIWDDDVPQ